jgi:transposase
VPAAGRAPSPVDRKGGGRPAPRAALVHRRLKRDLDAVVNGLTLPYSSGAVEGAVNRIKMLKRQMYGCASLDLLRKRVLLVR